jgi:hypothetical protein
MAVLIPKSYNSQSFKYFEQFVVELQNAEAVSEVCRLEVSYGNTNFRFYFPNLLIEA